MSAPEHQSESNARSDRIVTAGQLNLSPERQAFLAPRLRSLLSDFSKLEAFVASDTEPAMTADLANEVHRERV